jgi:hypothetical protein
LTSDAVNVCAAAVEDWNVSDDVERVTAPGVVTVTLTCAECPGAPVTVIVAVPPRLGVIVNEFDEPLTGVTDATFGWSLVALKAPL